MARGRTVPPPEPLRRRLYLSPASARAVRSRVSPEDRARLDQLIDDDDLRIVTTA